MDIGVARERRPVDRVIAFDDLAGVIDADQVRHLDLAEVHSERIDPEGIGEFRISCRDMTRHAFVEAKLGK